MARYFTDDEFRCHCCGQLPENGMDSILIEIADDIREKLGKPLTVLSAYRCEANNEACGGVKNSQHVQGCALDLTYDDFDADELAQLAEDFGADGIGKYYGQQFVHIDTREGGIGAGYSWEG